jgi:hypothetical protein
MDKKVSLLLLLTTLGSVPAFAQVDLTGEWAIRFHEDALDRGPGPEVGDYLGLPINAAARMRGHTWEAAQWTLPEWQCRPHGPDYMWRSISELSIKKEIDPVTREIKAYHFEWLRSTDNPIYMDGRPHPPEEAAHTWGGFATGKWEGDMLTVWITHLKESYIRRNGVPRSDLATVTEHLMRHGDWLTVAMIAYDPVYLTEPFIQTTDFRRDEHQTLVSYPCEVANEVERPKGVVPHKLPGTNKDIKEFSIHYGIPEDVAAGGAETMYPEYREKLKGVKAKYPGAPVISGDVP